MKRSATNVTSLFIGLLLARETSNEKNQITIRVLSRQNQMQRFMDALLMRGFVFPQKNARHHGYRNICSNINRPEGDRSSLMGRNPERLASS